MALETGARLGPYEVISSLGAGGMGEVYRARDTRLGRHVAIKVLPASASADTTSRDRFEREARTISTLSHPNICPLFDIGEQNGQSYLVMECLEGQTLSASLKYGALPIDRALAIAAQVADGLAHAHAAGVIHRDLKPANIMVLASGNLKILDFGLARKVLGDGDATMASLSESGVVSGTIAYMSPEQTLGQTLDHRSDLFSLGVVLYEMLCGVRPFEGASAFAIMQNVVTARPPPADAVRSGVPPAAARYLERLMAKSADQRPATAEEVAAAMRECAALSPSSPPGAIVDPAGPTITIAGRPAARRRGSRWRWSAAAAVVVLGGLSLAIPGWRAPIVDRAGRWFARPAAPQDALTAPVNAADWRNLGRDYLRRFDRQGNRDRAIDAFRKAIALDPSHAGAHAGLAEAYLHKDSLTPDVQWVRQATEAATRAVNLNSDLAVAHAALGAALLRAKQTDQGRMALERALDLDPRSQSALVALGEFHLAQGDLSQAETTYRRAVAAAPANEWLPAQLLGRSLYRQAKYPEAVAVWEDANLRAPDNVQILRNLGAVYHMVDRTDEAASALQRALELEPTATTYSNLGTLRFFQGRYTDAAAAFEKAVELNATHYLYWANLGDAYRWIPEAAAKAQQSYSRAVALIADRLRATPGDPDLQTQLAVYLAKRGDRELASRALQRWQVLAKKSPASHFRALVTHEIMGDRDAALAELQAALRAGYAQTEIKNEPELTKLRSDPRYHRIVAAFEAVAR